MLYRWIHLQHRFTRNERIKHESRHKFTTINTKTRVHRNLDARKLTYPIYENHIHKHYIYAAHCTDVILFGGSECILFFCSNYPICAPFRTWWKYPNLLGFLRKNLIFYSCLNYLPLILIENCMIAFHGVFNIFNIAFKSKLEEI